MNQSFTVFFSFLLFNSYYTLKQFPSIVYQSIQEKSIWYIQIINIFTRFLGWEFTMSLEWEERDSCCLLPSGNLIIMDVWGSEIRNSRNKRTLNTLRITSTINIQHVYTKSIYNWQKNNWLIIQCFRSYQQYVSHMTVEREVRAWFFPEVFFVTILFTTWVRIGKTVLYSMLFTRFTVFIVFCNHCFWWTRRFTIRTHCGICAIFRTTVFHWRRLGVLLRVWESFYVIHVAVFLLATIRNIGHRFTGFLQRGLNGGLDLVVFAKVNHAVFLWRD